MPRGSAHAIVFAEPVFAVPESSTWAMMVLGIAFIACHQKSKPALIVLDPALSDFTTESPSGGFFSWATSTHYFRSWPDSDLLLRSPSYRC